MTSILLFNSLSLASSPTATMKAALFLSALASAAVGVVAEELKIDVTLPVVCERKTQKGDKVQMHYRGTLKASGEQFDASKSARLASTEYIHKVPQVIC